MSLSGPQFLLLYLVIAVAANLWLRRHYRNQESAKTLPRFGATPDPYQIAYLRSGEKEAVRISIVALVDRGLLEESGGKIRIAHSNALQYARRPIEKAILNCYSDWAPPNRALEDIGVKMACQEYQDQLVKQQLLADTHTYARRWSIFITVLGITLGIAILRIVNALMHDRFNIGFLIILAFMTAVALFLAYRKRITGLGEAVLDRLKILFASLKRRAKKITPGGSEHDATVLAAIFGLAALPSDAFPFVDRLYPKNSKWDSSGDDGGFIGDSNGGSCDGGGCGGGGCGGGCGG